VARLYNDRPIANREEGTSGGLFVNNPCHVPSNSTDKEVVVIFDKYSRVRFLFLKWLNWSSAMAEKFKKSLTFLKYFAKI